MMKYGKYTLNQFIEQTRKNRKISQEELTEGIIHVKTYRRLIGGEIETEKVIWDTLLARMGVISLIYEGYISQSEYVQYEALLELRKQSNLLIRAMYEKQSKYKIDKICEEIREQIGKYKQTYSRKETGLSNLENFFLGIVEGYCQKSEALHYKKKGHDRSRHLENVWKMLHTKKIRLIITSEDRIALAPIELELLLQIADAFWDEQRRDEAEELVSWIWNYRKKHALFEDEMIKIYPYAAILLIRIKIKKGEWEKAWEIYKETIEIVTEAQSFRGMIYLLDLQLELWSHCQEHWFESEEDVLQIKTCILDLNQQYDENPYGIYPMYTLQNAVVANEVIRRKRIQRNLTQSVLSEGILEPENYSRYENGRLNIRWEKIAQILDRLEQNTEKEKLILDTFDIDVMEQYFQCGKLGYQAQMRYSRMWYRQLCNKLDMNSKINQQYIGFQNLVQQKTTFQRQQLELMEVKIRNLLRLTVAENIKYNEHERLWTRNEVLLFNMYANILYEEKKTSLAIELQREIIDEFEQYEIRKKYPCQAQTLLMANYSSMIGDIKNYPQALAINHSEIKCFLKNARAWGIQLILYDVAWNTYEAKQNNAKSSLSYQIAYRNALLLAKLQKDEVFLKFLYQRKDKYQN